MAIHSSVISCHINTYISGSYYKTCNGGASWLHWGFFKDIWQNVTGCAEKKKTTYISINPQDARQKTFQDCFIIIRQALISTFHFLCPIMVLKSHFYTLSVYFWLLQGRRISVEHCDTSILSILGIFSQWWTAERWQKIKRERCLTSTLPECLIGTVYYNYSHLSFQLFNIF